MADFQGFNLVECAS